MGQGNLQRRGHRLLRRRRPGRGNVRGRAEVHQHRRDQVLRGRPHRRIRPRFHLPDDAGERHLRGQLSPRHLHRLANSLLRKVFQPIVTTN